MSEYVPGSIRLKVLLDSPAKVANWPFPLSNQDKITLLTGWADPDTFSDLDTLCQQDLDNLFSSYVETITE
jgi:hypothetical protein